MTKKKTGWPSAGANPAKPATELAPLAGLAPSNTTSERDAKGRFLSGNNGGGRKIGSRNRLTDTFISAVEDDFAEYGTSALTKLREDDPAAYIKMVATLVPRDLILKREQREDLVEIEPREMAELVDRERHNALLNNWLNSAREGK